MINSILLSRFGVLPLVLGYVVYKIITGTISLNKEKRASKCAS
jgi:hypothetical protein